MTSRRRLPEPPGLHSLRRPGRLTEILFLHEVATHAYGRLKPIAERLGVSIQAASFLYRRLNQEGKVELMGGRYRATMAGIEDLHRSLDSLHSDLEDRMAKLQMVQKCRAIAHGPISAGAPVELFMEAGSLHARAGRRGPSRGIAVTDARPGDLIEVDHLSGILPLNAARVQCLVIRAGAVSSPLLKRQMQQLSAMLRDEPHSLLAAEGLEAVHLLGKMGLGPFVRFGVAAAARDAALLGVPVRILVTDERIPQLLHRLSEPTPRVEVEVRTLFVS